MTGKIKFYENSAKFIIIYLKWGMKCVVSMGKVTNN